MQADSIEVSWDAAKSSWLVRIQSGEEVIRRHSKLPQNADETALRSAAAETLKDEGYDASGATVKITR